MSFLKTKDFLDLTEISSDEIYKIISLATQLKAEGKNFQRQDLAGKSVGLIFNKPSTRTRVSFEVGAKQLGADSIYLHSSDLQINRGESFEDTAKVLSSYLDAIVLRTGGHEEAQELAKYASISVINALTDLHHPCQALADLMTIMESKGYLSGIKIAYLGDGNNVCNSLIIGAVKAGMQITVATPPGYEPDESIINIAKAIGEAKIAITNDPQKAIKGADVLYTDVWVSMGQEEEQEKRLEKFKPFQLNENLLSKANPEAIAMHCLPAHRGQEITKEVMASKQSVIFEQAENRLYSQKALLIGLLGNENEDKV